MSARITEAIAGLTSADETARICAAQDIGFANQAEGVGALLARLPVESSGAVREAIFSALQQIDDVAVAVGAVTLLDSEDAFLRNHAVALLRARAGQVIPFLAAAFRAGDRDRRKFILDVVADIIDPETSEIYRWALCDSDINVVITAVENVGNARLSAFRPRIEDLISSQTHPMLLGAAIEALAKIGDPASVDRVRAALGRAGEVPGYLRCSYLRLLGAKGAPTDVDEIAGLASSGGLDASALDALIALRNRFPKLNYPAGLAPRLKEAAHSATSNLVAYQALQLLATLLEESELDLYLASCLETSNQSVRMGAIHVLQERSTEESRRILSRCLAGETDEEFLHTGTSAGGA